MLFDRCHPVIFSNYLSQKVFGRLRLRALHGHALLKVDGWVDGAHIVDCAWGLLLCGDMTNFLVDNSNHLPFQKKMLHYIKLQFTCDASIYSTRPICDHVFIPLLKESEGMKVVVRWLLEVCEAAPDQSKWCQGLVQPAVLDVFIGQFLGSKKMLTGGWLQGGWSKKGCMLRSTCIQVAKASMMDMIPIIVRIFRNPSTSPTLKGAMLRFAWAFGNFTSIASADERYPVRNSRKCSENCAFVG